MENNKYADDFQVREILTIKSEEKSTFYVINFKPTGFIMVSASDATVPILASSFESNFSLENLPPQLNYLLNSYKVQIKEIEKQKIAPTSEIKQKWDNYTVGMGKTANSLKSASITQSQIGPLLQTQWNQNAGWNQFCPYDTSSPQGYGNHVPAGCGAVALAQILHKWGCRVNESGSHSINSTYGTLYADFTGADYQWSSMNLNSPDAYNSRLIYDCGIAINTQFGPTGSSSMVDYVESAILNYFGFKNTANDYYSNEYSDSEWKNLLKNDLDLGRPIFYTGYDDIEPNTSDHAWVIDGYNSLDQFRCNWGWGGYENGFYYLSDLSPHVYVYAGNFVAILNIEPVMPNCNGISGVLPTICPSGSSFAIGNLPSEATITWNKSSNIDFVSPQGSNPCIFEPNGIAGNGWISATVNFNGNATLEPINIWVGNPNYYFHIIRPDGHPVTTDEYGNTSFCSYTDYEISLWPNDYISCYTHDHDWGVPSTWTTNWINGSTISVNTGNDPQNFIAVDFMACCNDEDLYYSQYFEYSTSCAQYSLLLTPNPSSNETILTISSKTGPIIHESLEWDLEVYDSMQALKSKTQRIKGDKQTINTSSWKDGVYIVRAKIGSELISQKLVVKH